MERSEFDRFFDHFEAIDLANFAKSLKSYHDQFIGMTYEQVMVRVEERHRMLVDSFKGEKGR